MMENCLLQQYRINNNNITVNNQQTKKEEKIKSCKEKEIT